jgi:glutamate racemase
LIPQIKKILPQHIKIIDSGEAVALQTQKVLIESIGLSKSTLNSQIFYTNGKPEIIKNMLLDYPCVFARDF